LERLSGGKRLQNIRSTSFLSTKAISAFYPQGYPNGELEKLKEKADLVRVEENWKNQKILKNQKKLITWNARFAISKP
jgi:hypothetical protein